MAERSFQAEVDDHLFGLCQFTRHKDGRWSAILDPEMIWHSSNDEQKLPPGQCSGLTGTPEFYSWSVYDDLPAARRATDLWAARPYFYSRDAAVRMMLNWIRRERKDLVRMFESEVRRGRAWRNNRA